MSPRIRELWRQCYVEVPHERDWDAVSRVFDKEKFAQLIVRECIFAVDVAGGIDKYYYIKAITEHFGVEE